MTVPKELKELKTLLVEVEKGTKNFDEVKYPYEIEKNWIDRSLIDIRMGKIPLMEFIIQLNKLMMEIERI